MVFLPYERTSVFRSNLRTRAIYPSGISNDFELCTSNTPCERITVSSVKRNTKEKPHGKKII